MPRETFTVIQCPQCRQSLPSAAQRCQFCGAPVNGSGHSEATAPRAMAGITILSGKGAQNRDFSTWQDKAYRICSILMLLLGVVGILQGMNVIETAASSRTYIGVSSAVMAFMALMLLWEQTWAQFIMKWALILYLVTDVLNIPLLLLAIGLRPAMGGVLLLAHLLRMAGEGLMLYLLYTSGDA